MRLRGDDELQGSMAAEGMPRCAAMLRGAAAARGMAVEGLPRRRAAWLPRGANVRNVAADRGAMSRCKAARLPLELMKIHDFQFL